MVEDDKVDEKHWIHEKTVQRYVLENPRKWNKYFDKEIRKIKYNDRFDHFPDLTFFLEDGTVLASPLAGTFRREGSMVKLFFTDAVNNGDQNFVTWDIDMPGKHAKVRYFSLV